MISQWIETCKTFFYFWEISYFRPIEKTGASPAPISYGRVGVGRPTGLLRPTASGEGIGGWKDLLKSNCELYFSDMKI